MNNDIKSFIINVLAGLFTAIVFLYLDKNGLTSLGYVVFGLYAFLIFLIAYKIFKHRKPIEDVTNKQPNEKKETDIKTTSGNPNQPILKKFIYHNNLLWLTDDLAPYCPTCQEIDGKTIHVKSIRGNEYGEEYNFFECPHCHYKADFTEHPDYDKW